MGLGFKEVASLRGNDKKFEDNYNQINWGNSTVSKNESIEESKKETVLWTCNEDAEYLRHSDPNEAIEEYLDQLEREKFPETLIVHGFSRMVVDKARFKNVVLENAYEFLGEEYDGEDGHEINSEIEDACDFFITTYLKNYTPWSCEPSEKKEINVKEWVEKYCPHWLKEVNEATR